MSVLLCPMEVAFRAMPKFFVSNERGFMLRIAKFFNFANLNGTKINDLMTEAIIYTKRIHLWEKISNFGCSFLNGCISV